MCTIPGENTTAAREEETTFNQPFVTHKNRYSAEGYWNWIYNVRKTMDEK